jgi:hypothetical protein
LNIVKYFKNERGQRVFCINQAIHDGQYPDPKNIGAYSRAILIDRQTGQHHRVSHISGDESMYLINFDGGGFLCLDHTIEQFAYYVKHAGCGDILTIDFSGEQPKINRT